MKISLVRETSTPPYYATDGAAAFDLMADIDAPIDIWPGDIVKVPTGLKVELPKGTAGLVLPRSGAAMKGLTVANAPGLIDSDYRGEICVLARNVSESKMQINPSDRIAQLMVIPFVNVQRFEVVSSLSDTQRGEGGFGSTGVVHDQRAA